MVFDMGSRELEGAQVFDALGHPTRLRILRLLSDGPLSFAELKKKTNIDSSGHLQHHLTKLNGLIKTDQYGSYGLSDAGNDALFTIQTVENASKRRNRRFASHDGKSRTLLTIAIAALALCLIVSVLYLSNASFTLTQYATQTQTNTNQYVNMTNQYVNETLLAEKNRYLMDIMIGSLNDEGHESTSVSEPIEIAPGQKFNYTLMVFSSSNPPAQVYVLHDSLTIRDMPPFQSNDTYYQQGFVKFDMSVWGINSSELAGFHLYPIAGPPGWNGQLAIHSSSEAPPYPTVSTTDEYSPDVWSGNIPMSQEFIIPIEVLGNYTFCLANTGNSTVEMKYTIGTPVITLKTEPLQGFTAPNSWPSYTGERIVRIREEPSSQAPSQQPPQVPQDLSTSIHDVALTASNLTALMAFSAVTLVVCAAFTLNRRRI